MLTVKWQHIILAASGYAGTSRRIARMREAGAQFAPPYRQGNWSGNTWMPTPTASEWAPPTYAPPFSPADPFGNRTYEFVFWSVNGSRSSEVSFRLAHGGNPLPSISFGGEQWTLNAKAWYMWDRAGAGGPGEPEVEIDAFDLTSNDFISNDFVDIKPDGPADEDRRGLGPLTYSANEDGYIRTRTLTGLITIKARELESERYQFQFSHWLVIHSSGSPMPVVNHSTITVHPNCAMRAYAIYHRYDRVAADVRNPVRVEDELPTIGGVLDPGQVKDVLRTFVIAVDRNGVPIVGIGPGGEPVPVDDPIGPYVKQLVEMLHKRLES